MCCLGACFADGIMTCIATQKIRRKAVWGSRLTLGALSLALLFCSTLNAIAAGPHARNANHATPGVPSHSVKNYKLDAELTRRATKGNPQSTSSVIVTLVPG